MSDPTHVLVLTTLPGGSDLRIFAHTLVEERLAACVNILPEMRSVYRWQGHVETASEHQVIMKTTRSRIAALRERVLALHPYDLPEFVVVPIAEGSDAYLQWITDSTG